ncbi:Protein O-mannosyltransferase 2, partial [Coemansia sp. RSA 2702]
MASQFHLNPHPPLGKLLITLLFRAFGYTGGSSFDSGEPHPDFVPYVQMRRVQAVLGTLLVPVVFAACRALRLPEMAGWLAALFVALDNALIGISRINMLDSALLLANAAALYAIKLVSVSTIIVVGIYILADLVDLTIKSQRQT